MAAKKSEDRHVARSIGKATGTNTLSNEHSNSCAEEWKADGGKKTRPPTRIARIIQGDHRRVIELGVNVKTGHPFGSVRQEIKRLNEPRRDAPRR